MSDHPVLQLDYTQSLLEHISIDISLYFDLGSSGPSRRRLEYQRRRILRRRPMSAEYQLWKILTVGWGYQHIRHHYTLAGERLEGEWDHRDQGKKTRLNFFCLFENKQISQIFPHYVEQLVSLCLCLVDSRFLCHDPA